MKKLTLVLTLVAAATLIVTLYTDIHPLATAFYSFVILASIIPDFNESADTREMIEKANQGYFNFKKYHENPSGNPS
jgi:hypothetical protein